MKHLIISAVCIAILFTGNLSIGQDLSKPSPESELETRAGITDITINYSRPAVRGRTIFGDLVPYNEMWRTGANSATTINFSMGVTIADVNLPAGEYVLVTIPGESEWTIMLNKNPDATIWDYPKEDEVVNLKVKPKKCAAKERFTISVPDFDNGMAVISLEWAEVSVSIDVKLHTDKQVEKNINRTFGANGQAKVARYYKQQSEWDKALPFINKAIELNSSSWFSYWTKAEILAGKGDYKTALEFAEKANKMGNEPDVDFFYKGAVEKALVDWKKK
ncbi:MAG: DUF2911 domain-containing protein [Flavobacteriales bacterium]|nr:DUF2911 domain-containing protein [Flavobacteriales bacterium]